MRETGRGYPDVEILPALAETLGISVNELLDGEERPPKPPVNCPQPVAPRLKINWLKWSLIALVCLVVVIRLLYNLFGIGVLIFKADDFRGSKNCVISADYSTITYLGEVYVPLDTRGYECRISYDSYVEAFVEDMPLIIKYCFGDQVYEVTSVMDGSILYLRTDHDFPPSDYYVRESQKEQMEQIIADFSDAYVYAVIRQKDWSEREVPMPKGLPEYVGEDLQRECGKEGRDDCVIPMIVYEPNRIFYRMPGCVWYVGGEYYWHDGEDRNTNYHGAVYAVADAWDPMLDTLAGYMFQ